MILAIHKNENREEYIFLALEGGWNILTTKACFVECLLTCSNDLEYDRFQKQRAGFGKKQMVSEKMRRRGIIFISILFHFSLCQRPPTLVLEFYQMWTPRKMFFIQLFSRAFRKKEHFHKIFGDITKQASQIFWKKLFSSRKYVVV